jgi:hypothetical protein
VCGLSLLSPWTANPTIGFFVSALAIEHVSNAIDTASARTYVVGFFFLPGKIPISLQMIPSMISSAPPPIESRRVSR